VITDRRAQIGGLAWLGCAQFFAAEAIAASRYPGAYSYRFDFISDLGAATCAKHCSPLHTLMNASFLLQGVLIATGLVLIRPRLGADGASRIGALCLFVCAVGVFVVGAAPEDVAPAWHYAGAAANLAGCNLAALAIGLGRDAAASPVRRAGVLLGGLGLIACLAFLTQIPDRIGVGLVERLAAYPFLFWLIAFGAAVLRGVDSRARRPCARGRAET
jgi:hypothetical membrane protein